MNVSKHVGRQLLALCLLGVCLASPSAARASASIYDNFAPGNGYNPNVGWTLSIGAPIYAHNRFAVPFTPAVTTTLSSIELAISIESGTNELDVWLMSDAAGPAAIIEAFHLSGAMGPFPSAAPPLLVVSAVNPVLTAGTRYWIAANVSGPDSLAHWHWNTTGDVGDVAFWTFSDPWGIYQGQERAAFRVTGSSPSPAKLWLGLKNSDDQGTQFDVWAALYLNDVLVGEERTLCVTGLTRNASKAKEVSVPFDPVFSSAPGPGDVISLKIFTRIGTNPDGSKCSGHNNATGLRLYYDAESRPSRFGAQIAPDPFADYFLHGSGANLFFDTTSPTSTQPKQKDSGPVNFAGGNPWVAVGTWSLVVP